MPRPITVMRLYDALISAESDVRWGSRPIRCVASGPVSFRRCGNEATGVEERMSNCTAGGQARSRWRSAVAEGQEFRQFLIGPQDVSSEVVGGL